MRKGTISRRERVEPSWTVANPGRSLGEIAHRVRYLSNFSRKWSTFEAPVNTVPWWRLLREELWQGVRAPPLGKLTCNQCSNRLKEDKLQVCNKGTLQRTWHKQNKGAHAYRERFWALNWTQ